MKINKMQFYIVALVACVFAVSVETASAQFDVLKKTETKINKKMKDAEGKTKPAPKPENTNAGNDSASAANSDDDSDARAENAKKLAKATGMPKAANADAELNKRLFQAADDHRLIPRRVVVTDKDYLMTADARGTKVRRIFAVLGRTLDDGSGKCGKQMVQFDQDWKQDKNAWGAVYVQNIGEVTPIACSAIGK